jgi:class 3 adenylate cyclase
VKVIVSGNIAGDIAAYVPGWIRASVSETDGARLTSASAIARPAAILFLDMAGFTEITDRFAQQAENGAEQLSELLNKYFSTLTDVVDAFGGDIVAFTGDGFLAAWSADDEARATRVAAQCALALQHEVEVRAKSADVAIRQRVSVDVGTVYYCRLGGHDGLWRYVVVGSPFENVGLAYRKAAVGEIVLCEAAWRKLADDCEGKSGDGIFRLRRLRASFEAACPPLETPLVESDQLLGLVPAVVVDRLRVGSSKWLAEFRNVSVLCISFLGVVFEENVVEFLQPCILSAQRAASRLEGAIFAVWMDDKGFCALLVFGAPPLAHEEGRPCDP